MKTANIEVTLLGHYGSDLEVVNAARVSFHKQSEWEYLNPSCVDEHYRPIPKHSDKVLSEKDTKLIKYLASHKHHSPFNHCFLSFRVKAPIFVARQLVKHKFLPWNEVSRRYVDEEPEVYFPDYWRKKAENVKQGSSEEPVDPNRMWITAYTQQQIMYGIQTYNELLKAGVCPEQARMVLPQNTMTEWVWSGTLGAWLDMLVLRLDSGTQRETQKVAKKIAAVVQCLFPVSYGAYIHE